MKRRFLILFLGADWWGSDARALAASLRADGHALIEVNYEDYFPTSWSRLPLRLVRRAVRRQCSDEFNRAVAQRAGAAVDFVLAFKGMLLKASTLRDIRHKQIPAYCFYPDVSFRDHGRNISECLPLYGRIFTTKRFHQDDTALPAGVNLLQIVRHGFDPAVHRRLELSSTVWESYACDASFVGCWSPKKEALLQALIDAIPSLKLKVWGIGWGRCGADVRRHWTARGAFGDELAIVYGASAINLGLLSEAGGGTIIGDQVTARTWQIPAAAAFMLHEDTRELRDYFQPDKEVGVFADAGDLVRKVEYYLAHAPEREAIAAAGYARCVREDYTYVEAARAICKYHASQHPLADDS